MFPLSIGREWTLNETSALISPRLKDVETLLVGQGAEILERTSTAVGFRAPFLFGPGSVYPSSLFLVDDGVVELEPAMGGMRLTYWLSTKRMALWWFLGCMGVGAAAVALFQSWWALPISVVGWGWAFGFNYIAQRMRAEALFATIRGAIS